MALDLSNSSNLEQLALKGLSKIPTWGLRGRYHVPQNVFLVICPISIAQNGTDNETVFACVCPCVCLSFYLSVCLHSYSLIFWSIFTISGKQVKTEKRERVCWGSSLDHPSPIMPQKLPKNGRE